MKALNESNIKSLLGNKFVIFLSISFSFFLFWNSSVLAKLSSFSSSIHRDFDNSTVLLSVVSLEENFSCFLEDDSTKKTEISIGSFLDKNADNKIPSIDVSKSELDKDLTLEVKWETTPNEIYFTLSSEFNPLVQLDLIIPIKGYFVKKFKHQFKTLVVK